MLVDAGDGVVGRIGDGYPNPPVLSAHDGGAVGAVGNPLLDTANWFRQIALD